MVFLLCNAAKNLEKNGHVCPVQDWLCEQNRTDIDGCTWMVELNKCVLNKMMVERKVTEESASSAERQTH